MANSEKFEQPDRQAFLNNERSKQIRGVCISALKRVRNLIRDPDLADDADARLRVEGELEAINGKLIELGVRREMHVGKKPHEFADPVMAVEFIAGQVCVLLGHKIPSEKSIEPIVREFHEKKTELDGINAYSIIGNQSMPERYEEFNICNAMLNAASRMLDADEEIFDIKEEDDD